MEMRFIQFYRTFFKMEQCAFSVNDNWKFHCHLKGLCLKINIKSFEYIQSALRRSSCPTIYLFYDIHDDDNIESYTRY